MMPVWQTKVALPSWMTKPDFIKRRQKDCAISKSKFACILLSRRLRGGLHFTFFQGEWTQNIPDTLFFKYYKPNDVPQNVTQRKSQSERNP